MEVHYYCHTSEQVRNFAYETFDYNDIIFTVQCTGLFGVNMFNSTIKKLLIIMECGGLYHRFSIENFEINTDEEGNLMLSEKDIQAIGERTNNLLR